MEECCLVGRVRSCHHSDGLGVGVKGECRSKEKELVVLKMKSHPLLCGPVETTLHLVTRKLGLHLAVAWRALLSVANLQPPRPNPRPRRSLARHGPLHRPAHARHPLHWRPPQPPDVCLNCYTLILGLSATNFASNRRPANRLATSKSGARTWHAEAPLLSTLTGCYAKQRRSIADMAPAIEGVPPGNECPAAERASKREGECASAEPCARAQTAAGSAGGGAVGCVLWLHQHALPLHDILKRILKAEIDADLTMAFAAHRGHAEYIKTIKNIT